MSALPQQRLITAEEFAALPRTGLRTELVRGTIIPGFSALVAQIFG